MQYLLVVAESLNIKVIRDYICFNIHFTCTIKKLFIFPFISSFIWKNHLYSFSYFVTLQQFIYTIHQHTVICKCEVESKWCTVIMYSASYLTYCYNYSCKSYCMFLLVFHHKRQMFYSILPCKIAQAQSPWIKSVCKIKSIYIFGLFYFYLWLHVCSFVPGEIELLPQCSWFCSL